MLSLEKILDRTQLKILHKSVFLKTFLLFSMQVIFSPIKGIFAKGFFFSRKFYYLQLFLDQDYYNETLSQISKIFQKNSLEVQNSFDFSLLDLDLFIIALWNVYVNCLMVINGAILAQTYFLIETQLLNMLKRSKIIAFKVTFQYVKSKFSHSFLKSHFKSCQSKQIEVCQTSF